MIRFLKGELKKNIVDIKYDKKTKFFNVKFEGSNSHYSYIYNDVEKVEIINVDHSKYVFSNEYGRIFTNLVKVICYKGTESIAFEFYFKNGDVSFYNHENINYSKNITSLEIGNNNSLLDYYKVVVGKADVYDNSIGRLLLTNLENIANASKECVLYNYITRENQKEKIESKPLIYPFETNLSQMKAVENVFKNKISVIEGPPGCGKTQTILNIISNIVYKGSLVAVVSNTNSATDNIYEKLKSCNYHFFAAQLGKTENKEIFLENQIEYPEDIFLTKEIDVFQSSRKLNDRIEKIKKRFKIKNEIAINEMKINELNLEKNQYMKQHNLVDVLTFKKISKEVIIKQIEKLKKAKNKTKKISFLKKIILLFKTKEIATISSRNINDMIKMYEYNFFVTMVHELNNENCKLENELNSFNIEMEKEVKDISTLLFKNMLTNKYCKHNNCREKFQHLLGTTDFIKEYPVILSTTHSIISSLQSIMYDYVIIDESSQVDVVTSLLAMSVAKNIVFVGDLKQLSAIINNPNQIKKIGDDFNIHQCYRVEKTMH